MQINLAIHLSKLHSGKGDVFLYIIFLNISRQSYICMHIQNYCYPSILELTMELNYHLSKVTLLWTGELGHFFWIYFLLTRSELLILGQLCSNYNRTLSFHVLFSGLVIKIKLIIKLVFGSEAF